MRAVLARPIFNKTGFIMSLSSKYKGFGFILFLLLSFFVALGVGLGKKNNLPIPQNPENQEECTTCHSPHDMGEVRENMNCESCHSSIGREVSMKVLGALEYNKQTVAQNQGKDVGDMVLIPEGSFHMGYDKRHPDEGPEHQVNLPKFYMDKFEVTNEQYKRFVELTKRPSPEYWRDREYPSGKDDHPVTYVTWVDAHDYCQWVNKRLPIEQEWEKAARGIDGRLFPWGNTFDPKKANTPQSKIGDTTPVGNFSEGRSPFGLYDMGGNVWEWTEDWAKAYPGNPRPKAHYYTGRYKVLRGGSWVDCSFYRCGISAFTFNRGYFKPETKNRGFGFRCAKSP